MIVGPWHIDGSDWYRPAIDDNGKLSHLVVVVAPKPMTNWADGDHPSYIVHYHPYIGMGRPSFCEGFQSALTVADRAVKAMADTIIDDKEVWQKITLLR